MVDWIEAKHKPNNLKFLCTVLGYAALAQAALVWVSTQRKTNHFYFSRYIFPYLIKNFPNRLERQGNHIKCYGKGE